MQYVYLIKCKSGWESLYKIGIANDVQSRLAQLQTGNPYELEILESYGFENAEIVERSIHQAFKNARVRGEWFELNTTQAEEDFRNICRMLGGEYFPVDNEIPTDDQVSEAEEISEVPEGGKWDFRAMFADGWRIEPSSSRGKNGVYWAWRKTESGKRPYIYGGKISDLPYPMEDMRRVYGSDN